LIGALRVGTSSIIVHAPAEDGKDFFRRRASTLGRRQGRRNDRKPAAPSKDEGANRGIRAARPCLALRACGRCALL